jgi:predicted ferric reductase
MTNAGLWFCGPAPMRVGLIDDLKGMGKMPTSVHFEQFEFR